MAEPTAENRLKRSAEKPSRPAGFPLFAHRSGQWAKKVRGTMRYFGPWSQIDLALARWNAWKDDLLVGRPIRPTDGEQVTLKELCNDFLTAKKAKLETGQLTQRSWDDYLQACQRLCKILGKEMPVPSLVPADFERLRAALGKSWGPVRVGNEIQRMRCVFRHGERHKILDALPTYGDAFAKPSKNVLRKARALKGARMFEAGQIHKLLQAANPTMKAMILLGINCGLGNGDIAGLMRRHIDFKKGWLDYPRPKTGVQRRAKLWPETLAAIRAVLRARKAQRARASANARGEAEPAATIGTADGATIEPQADKLPAKRPPKISRKLVFLTRRGTSWAQTASGNPISAQMLALARACKVWRPGLNFYALRHTFETIGGDSRDQVAVDYVMGHVADSKNMAAVYRERIFNDRLTAVADHVHAWLFEEQKSSG